MLKWPWTPALALPWFAFAACSGRIAADHGQSSSPTGTQLSGAQQSASGARDAPVAGDPATSSDFDSGPSDVADAAPTRLATWPPAAPDAGLPVAGASCSDMVADGAGVEYTFVQGPSPDLGLGGSIADGVYDLTAFIRYDSSATQTVGFDGEGGSGTTQTAGSERETIRISGGGTRLEYQSNDFLGGSTDLQYNGHGLVLTLAPSGSALNDVAVCPHDPTYEDFFIGRYYTATPLQFISIDSGYRKVFQRRP
jgi:hypothetical protein